MHPYKFVFLILAIFWCCSMMESKVVQPMKPLQSHITGGYKNIQMKSSKSALNCNQYANDYEVLFHFSFLIMINPMTQYWNLSVAQMDSTDTYVQSLWLFDTDGNIPESIFCLKKLTHLYIKNMAFVNGIVPDTLANLKDLTSLSIVNAPIISMTEQLASLSKLRYLTLSNCSLSQLPNLSNISNLAVVDLGYNHLSQIDGLNAIYGLFLHNNLFTEIPTLTIPERLHTLYISKNPLKHVMKLNLFVNLDSAYLQYTNISFIPPAIEKLQNLTILDLSYNKLFYLPNNMLKLTKLQSLSINGNSFSVAEIKNIQEKFKIVNPNITLTV